MLLVQTRLAPSRIHGVGVMAVDAIPSGEPIWRFAPGLDLVLPQSEISALPGAFRAYLDTYAYTPPEFPDSFVLSCDHAKFLNHSEDPNTVNRGRETFAWRDIAEGEEITCDYRTFVVGWTGFD